MTDALLNFPARSIWNQLVCVSVSCDLGCVPLEIKPYNTSTHIWKTVSYFNDTDTDTLKTKCRHILQYTKVI